MQTRSGFCCSGADGPDLAWWQWVTVNHGETHGITRGSFLALTRRGRRVAVAEVERAKEKRAVAWILEGTMRENDAPRLGDAVSVLA